MKTAQSVESALDHQVSAMIDKPTPSGGIEHSRFAFEEMLSP
jgi:hypothetical protein